MRRLLTPGFFSASKRITVSVSVTALFTFFAVTFGSSSRLMRPFGAEADLLILTAGSWRSKIFAVSLRMYGAGTVNVWPYRPLNRSARSRVSSMCWRWSSPTGTWFAW